MNALQRELFAILVGCLFLLISHGQITLTDADYEFEPAEEIITFTDEELDEALSSGILTADQCVWMEIQQIDWQIDVKR